MVDASGNYEFRNLCPGSYTLELDPSTLPAKFRLPTQSVWPVMVKPLEGVYLDIPLSAQRAVSGIVFIDNDGDGFFDPRIDEVVVGARVTAARAEAFSGSGGSYVLRNLPAGQIEIRARTEQGGESHPFVVELEVEPATRRSVNLRVTR
jgi:hypothetical protein